MPYLQRVDPGYLVAWWPPSDEPNGMLRNDALECQTKFFAGEHAARDARLHTKLVLERFKDCNVRVFVMLEVYHVQGTVQRRLHDDHQPVVDLLLREQMAGRGLTTAIRAPARRSPAEVIQAAKEYVAAPPSTPAAIPSPVASTEDPSEDAMCVTCGEFHPGMSCAPDGDVTCAICGEEHATRNSPCPNNGTEGLEKADE